MNSDVEVRPSHIHGRGVFALKDFEPGETVLEWDTTHVIADDALDSFREDERDFLTRFNGKWIVMQPPMRFVNHSCEPNTRSESGKDIAVRVIKAGEEITSDYRPELKAGERMECHCGAPSCTGYIVGTGL